MAEPTGGPEVALSASSLIEELSAIEHERWSHWQRYLHDQCERHSDGSLTIPAELVRRWSEQMSTPYAQLSERDKESDREQVRRYLPVILNGVADGHASST